MQHLGSVFIAGSLSNSILYASYGTGHSHEMETYQMETIPHMETGATLAF